MFWIYNFLIVFSFFKHYKIFIRLNLCLCVCALSHCLAFLWTLWPLLGSFLFRLNIFISVIIVFLSCSFKTLHCAHFIISLFKKKLHVLFVGSVCSSLIRVSDQWHDWQIYLCVSKVLYISKYKLNLCSPSKVNPPLENNTFYNHLKNKMETKVHSYNIFPSWSISMGSSFK